MAKNKQYQPVCDNCSHVRFRNDRHGDVHRFCSAFGNWIPDEEMFPTCDSHDFCKSIKEKINRKNSTI